MAIFREVKPVVQFLRHMGPACGGIDAEMKGGNWAGEMIRYWGLSHRVEGG